MDQNTQTMAKKANRRVAAFMWIAAAVMISVFVGAVVGSEGGTEPLNLLIMIVSAMLAAAAAANRVNSLHAEEVAEAEKQQAFLSRATGHREGDEAQSVTEPATAASDDAQTAAK